MILYQVLMGGVAAVTAFFAFHARCGAEEKLEHMSLKEGEKTALLEPMIFPMMLAVIFAMGLLHGNVAFLSFLLIQMGAVFFHISIYYALLLLLLPLLRRIISARACATLWLLPTLLYFLIYLNFMGREPLFVLTLPRRYLLVFMVVWAGGFIAVLLWQLISHLRFRRTLLRDAAPLENTAVLDLWRKALRRHGVKRPIPIYVADAVQTPLTVGCFDRTMVLVLPRRGYTEGELDLIFRHELRHILRCDTRTKLLLGFFTAMCWFNPLAWIARRKVADDLELSCDEAVLSGADEAQRRQYAQLLLESAGDGRGYTTCLSAAAGTLRHRLRNVVKPARRLSGAFAVSAALFLLITSFGAVAFVDGTGTVGEQIFPKAPADLSINWVAVNRWNTNWDDYRTIYGYDAAALTEYLSSRSVRRVYTGNYEERPERQFYVDYAEVVDGEVVSLTSFELCGGLLFVNIPYDDFGPITYLLEDEVDWAYIESLLDFDAPNPDPAPQPPDLFLYLTGPESEEYELSSEPLFAQKRVLSITDASGYRKPESEYSGIGGTSNIELTEAKLTFSYAPAEYTVTVELWDGSESYMARSSDLTDNVLPLSPKSARYTVRGSFDTVRDTHYEMEFYFDIQQPGDPAEAPVFPSEP